MMLSRVAGNLYWMGRYIERTEHLARYLKVQYFATLDAPIAQDPEFFLESIMNMVGLPYEEGALMEEDVLVSVALDEENPSSIMSSVNHGRENARAARDVISLEVWETINKYYHFVNNYPVDIYKTRGLYDFTNHVMEYCSVVRGNINNTLLHDEVWALIRLGTHMERAAQIARLLWSKLYDIEKLRVRMPDISLDAYQWSTVLKTAEAIDMARKYYKRSPTQENALDFLVLHQRFPRSILYNLDQSAYYMSVITDEAIGKRDSASFELNRMADSLKYFEVQDFEPDVLTFLHNTLNDIYGICGKFEKDFLSY